MEKAYLGIGSNLGDSASIIQAAVRDLSQSSGITLVSTSSLYRSKPLDNSDQPYYMNAVVEIATSLTPQGLLASLQGIEQQHGRVRGDQRWAARTLDLDILLFGAHTIASETLTIPHYGIKDRDFVLYPLQEIAPELVIPNLGALTELLANCPRRGLELVGPIPI